MFTGIIQAVGTVRRMDRQGDAARLCIDTGRLDMSEVKPGDSIAVNGVCLTAVTLDASGFCADVSMETLGLTTLGDLRAGMEVNLEPALTPGTRLGGHLVSGHVDGVGRIIERRDVHKAVEFMVEAPAELARYIAHKGSITVDGVSLTVNEVSGNRFRLTIVPHTLAETTIRHYRPGTRVNLEVDLIARYLERLLLGDKAADPAAEGLDAALLERAGLHRKP
ncbi:MAG: riboflavin synthase [Gammaproteobacteria bacterium]|nr:MAG: riboflavin synthase [Gammaproteobacteria bacterium]